ncbi:MAG: porin [Betaproteobacteria bacterium]|nr:porin [Betaproteobacteria bacterium]
MQKKLIALAVAGLASSAVFAQQNNVTIYGVIDVGIDVSNNGYGTQFRAQSGQSAGTRIGFKGEEALGNGLKAVWLLEQGLAIDTAAVTPHGTTATAPGINTASAGGVTAATNGQFFNRQAYGGLAGNWGQVTIGRQYTPFWYLKTSADAFNYGLSPTIRNLYAGIPGDADRLDNSILYISPNLSGFLFAVGYSTGNENNVDGPVNGYLDKMGRTWGVLAMYSNSGLWLGAAYHNARAGDFATEVGKADAWMLAGSYDFKVAKVYASYGEGKLSALGHDQAKARTWHIAGSMPFGNHKIMASYGKLYDRIHDDADFSVYGIGYEYAFSKRTSLYAALGWGDNDDNAAYGLNTAVNNGLSNTKAGKTVSSFNLGVRHSF